MAALPGARVRPSRSIFSVFERPEEVDNALEAAQALETDTADRVRKEDIELGMRSVNGKSAKILSTTSPDQTSLFRFPGSSRHFAYTSLVDKDERESASRNTADDDDVPESIFHPNNSSKHRSSRAQQTTKPSIPSPLSLRQRVHQAAPIRPPVIDAKQHALWMWINVQEPDAFLQEVYNYYIGNGASCILFSRLISVATLIVVISFSTFLLRCINYSRLLHSKTLSEACVDQCITKLTTIQIMVFLSSLAVCGFKIFGLWGHYKRLCILRNFYLHLLHISDSDIQSIPWPEVVKRLQAIKDENPAIASASISSQGSGQTGLKLDAHDIANRIMRAENYLIALFNKDVLDLRIPTWLPIPYLRGQVLLTRALEWNLSFCLLGCLLDQRGQVREQFVQLEHRDHLVQGLRRRFYFMAILHLLFAPLILLYMLVYTFLRYFEEYHRNPSSFGGRQYTQFALWKFREFNELPHVFRRRVRNSYPLAQAYVDQFPKEKTALAAKFVAFVAGSFTAVLLLFSVIHPELALTLEITQNKTVLFYLGISGTILAIARGAMPDEKTVWDHEDLMRGVIEHTHYLPSEWQDQLHSEQVHRSFGQLFRLKIIIFLEEMASIIVSPFVLWYSLADSSEAIIDFLRDYSVHVDGLGYVCSFAIFDFERHGNDDYGVPNEDHNVESDEDTELEPDQDSAHDELSVPPLSTHMRSAKLTSNGGKMEQSIINFKQEYPEWSPQDVATSQYLDKLSGKGFGNLQRSTRVNGQGDASPNGPRASTASRMTGSQIPQYSTVIGPAGARLSSTIYNFGLGPSGMADSMMHVASVNGGGAAALIEYNKRTKRLSSKESMFKTKNSGMNGRNGMSRTGHVDREAVCQNGKIGAHASMDNTLQSPTRNNKSFNDHGTSSDGAKSPINSIGGSSYGSEALAEQADETNGHKRPIDDQNNKSDPANPFRDGGVMGLLNEMYDKGGQLV